MENLRAKAREEALEAAKQLEEVYNVVAPKTAVFLKTNEK